MRALHASWSPTDHPLSLLNNIPQRVEDNRSTLTFSSPNPKSPGPSTYLSSDLIYVLFSHHNILNKFSFCHFLKSLFLYFSDLYSQGGSQVHDVKIKRLMFFRLSQSGTPIGSSKLTNISFKMQSTN